MTQQALFEAAAALPEKERLVLVEALLPTLGPETDGVDEMAFVAELQRRSDELDNDHADVVRWSDLKNEPF